MAGPDCAKAVKVNAAKANATKVILREQRMVWYISDYGECYAWRGSLVEAGSWDWSGFFYTGAGNAFAAADDNTGGGGFNRAGTPEPCEPSSGPPRFLPFGATKARHENLTILPRATNSRGIIMGAFATPTMI